MQKSGHSFNLDISSRLYSVYVAFTLFNLYETNYHEYKMCRDDPTVVNLYWPIFLPKDASGWVKKIIIFQLQYNVDHSKSICFHLVSC